MKQLEPDHTSRAKPPKTGGGGVKLLPRRPSPACRHTVNSAVGPLTGQSSHTTGVGQAVAGPLTGAAFPECTAAPPKPAELQLLPADEPNERRTCSRETAWKPLRLTMNRFEYTTLIYVPPHFSKLKTKKNAARGLELSFEGRVTEVGQHRSHVFVAAAKKRRKSCSVFDCRGRFLVTNLRWRLFFWPERNRNPPGSGAVLGVLEDLPPAGVTAERKLPPSLALLLPSSLSLFSF